MHTDDPRLTAYALGELDPPEQAEIEAFLQSNPDAAQEVAEIRELATLVRTQLATEDAPPLAPEQKREILSEASATRPVKAADPRTTTPWRQIWMPAAIAACAAVIAGYGAIHFGRTHEVLKTTTLNTEAEGVVSPATPLKTNRALLLDSDERRNAAPQPALAAAPDTTENRTALGFVTAAAEPKPAETQKSQSVVVNGNGTFELNGTTVSAPVASDRARKTLAQPESAAAPRWDSSIGVAGQAGEDKMKRQPAAAPAVADGTTVVAGTITLNPTPAKREAGDLAKDAKALPAEQNALSLPVEKTLAPDAPAAGAFAGNLGTAVPHAMAAATPQAMSAMPPAAAPAPFARAMPATVSGATSVTTPAAKGVIALGDRSSASVGSGLAAPAKKPGYYYDAQTRTKQAAAPGGKAEGLAPAPSERVAQLRTFAAADDVDQVTPFDRPRPAKPMNSPVPAEKAKESAPDQSSYYKLAPETPAPALLQTEPSNTDSYDVVTDNPFLEARGNPLSTFSIDVDTASYSNVRRLLTAGERPPKGAVRIEELVNYFSYDYPQPKAGEPFSVNMEVAACPWTPAHRLLRIGLKARDLDPESRPQANLVFLLDVSGSMMPENRLPLVKQCLRLLVEKLGPQDTVAIAVYAGASGTVLEPTNDKAKIVAALDKLEAGGSTNGAAGIKLAYDLAKKRFQKDRTNRVILATDGDFNVGVTNQSDLTDLIKAKAKSGVFLTVLGFGYGNLKDSTLEKLADQGNGNYGYIDTLAEGRKMLVEQMSGTLFTVAKDVKMQIEFNPAQVEGYRLIGYENRMLAKEDFNDDTKDAGEIGAGHTVTALYEVVPAGLILPGGNEVTKVDELKYQPARGVAGSATAEPAALVDTPKYPAAAAAKGSAEPAVDAKAPTDEMLTLKLRWKAPDGDVSTKREFPLTDSGVSWEKSSRDFRWAASVASFGMLLRDSPHKGQANWASTRELAIEGQGQNADSHRIEFLDLIGKAEALTK